MLIVRRLILQRLIVRGALLTILASTYLSIFLRRFLNIVYGFFTQGLIPQGLIPQGLIPQGLITRGFFSRSRFPVDVPVVRYLCLMTSRRSLFTDLTPAR
jgi:branched-subunit amino acid ABC-type transport system permease component